MNDNERPQPAKRNYWIERGVFAAIIIAIAGWIAYTHLAGTPYTITVDGEPVVSVESRTAAKTVLNKARMRYAGDVPSSSVRFTRNVQLRPAADNADLSDVPEAVRALENTVAIEVEAYAVTVNDEPIVALASQDDAEETLTLVKRFHERKITKLYTQSSFRERVFVEKLYVGVDKLHSGPKEAIRVLTSISEEALLHTIQRGDRAVKLAPQYRVSFDQLKKLNPGKDLNQLVEGDQLVIKPAKLPVTVLSKAMLVKTVKVTPPQGSGRYGREGTRVMRVLVTYENGEPVNEEIVSQVTTWNEPARTSTTRRR